jgi:tRNA dimethylallyltransferase
MTEPVLALMGPTASGKSALAERLAERFEGELISVDSALVYKGLSIGAAKPDYPHHLVHIRDPADIYTAADFARDAAVCIDEVRARGRRPILVGGSMLYFRALIQGFDEVPTIDPAIRVAIEEEARILGWPALHEQLAALDPLAAAQLHPNHSQRICRALEVYRGTGRPLSEWQQRDSPGVAMANTDFECLALCPEERQILHARIAHRMDAMFDAGLIDEVTALYQRGDLHTDLPAIRAVGYRQVWSFLEGELNLADCREKVLAATRQLAKRQITWLRSWPGLDWVLTDAHGHLLRQERADARNAGSVASTAMPQEPVRQVWKSRIMQLMRNF